jgi:hypothetical protein
MVQTLKSSDRIEDPTHAAALQVLVWIHLAMQFSLVPGLPAPTTLMTLQPQPKISPISIPDLNEPKQTFSGPQFSRKFRHMHMSRSIYDT